MDIGFETIGNATLICHDRGPVLVTDPWITGSAYFGSWTFSHEIPSEQLSAIETADFVWLSHGHPDHLSMRSMRSLKGKRVLLPDHVGGRIASFLRGEGHDVTVLPDRTWVRISDRITICSVADYNQDGILLANIDGRLVVNLNDASDRGWRGFVRTEVRRHPKSFLLCLSGFGDADMINVFDEDGRRLPQTAHARAPVGAQITRKMRIMGTTHFAPFSSMHKYQRSDSVWADRYTTGLDDYADGFDPSVGELLPPFVRYDCAADTADTIDPPERRRVIKSPQDFGDDPNDELEVSDQKKVAEYFRSISHVERHFDFINTRVGGKDNVVEFRARRLRRGITFEVPRTSLMLAVEHEIFDDLLIGNFMRTIVHGSAGLYPHFSPYVAKYADNGRARSRTEVRSYFRDYRKRGAVDYLRHRLERRSRMVARTLLVSDSAVYKVTRKGYRRLRGF
jgi:L-ascorbate metabolism protein UlaG (beta-lactamase superfamily)